MFPIHNDKFMVHDGIVVIRADLSAEGRENSALAVAEAGFWQETCPKGFAGRPSQNWTFTPRRRADSEGVRHCGACEGVGCDVNFFAGHAEQGKDLSFRVPFPGAENPAVILGW